MGNRCFLEKRACSSIQTQSSMDVTTDLMHQTYLASEVEELKQKETKLLEEKAQLEARNQKLTEESVYTKELAFVTSAELKALSKELIKLMNRNERLDAELTSLRNSSLPRASNGPKTTRRDSAKRHDLTTKRELSTSYEQEQELASEATLLEKQQRETEL